MMYVLLSLLESFSFASNKSQIHWLEILSQYRNVYNFLLLTKMFRQCELYENITGIFIENTADAMSILAKYFQ